MTSLDSGPIESFVRGEYRGLVRAVALVLGDKEAAEDCVQEAIARAWIGKRGKPEIRSLRNWVLAVALNIARSRLRRIIRERRALARLVPSVADPGPDAAWLVDVGRAVAELPQRQREVVALYYFMDFDVATVASTIGVSGNAVKNALFKARASLAIRLAPAITEEEDNARERYSGQYPSARRTD